MTNTNAKSKVSQKIVDLYSENHIVVSARYMDELDFPTVELTTMDADTYYLQPFRGYRMQISGSPDGVGDYGSSDVVGLGNVINMSVMLKHSNSSIYASNVDSSSNGMIKEMLRLLINQAFHNVTSDCWSWHMAIRPWEWSKVEEVFIKKTIDYLKKVDSEF